MSQPPELPEGVWRSLFQSALTVINEIRVHGGVRDPFFTFGGGTVLMLRHGHRMSKDIDIFVPDPQSLGYVSPLLSDVAAELCDSQYFHAAGYVKLQLEEGEIDFVAAPNLLPNALAYESWQLFDQTIRVETAAEIVAKKMFHRGDKATARDLFDLALVIEREPQAMALVQPFCFRHADKFAENLQFPSARYVQQFCDIDTLNYRPTFETASRTVLTYLAEIKKALEKSALAANEFAVSNGYTIQAVNVDQGNYIGKLVFVTSHHVVQHLGKDRVTVHENHRLPIALQNTVGDTSLRILYRDGSAQSVSKAPTAGRER